MYIVVVIFLFDHSTQTVPLVSLESVPPSSCGEHHKNTADVCQATGGIKPPESITAMFLQIISGSVWKLYGRYWLSDIISRVYNLAIKMEKYIQIRNITA